MIVNTSILAFITLAIHAVNIAAVPVTSATDDTALNARFEDSSAYEFAARDFGDFEDLNLEVREVDELDSLERRSFLSGLKNIGEDIVGAVSKGIPKAGGITGIAEDVAGAVGAITKGTPKAGDPKGGAPKGAPKSGSNEAPKGRPKGAPKGATKNPKSQPNGEPKNPKSQPHTKQSPKSQNGARKHPKVGASSTGQGVPKGGSTSGGANSMSPGNGPKIDNTVTNGGQLTEDFYFQL